MMRSQLFGHREIEREESDPMLAKGDLTDVMPVGRVARTPVEHCA